MKAAQFIKQLEVLRKPVFTISDFVKILSKDEKYAKIFIFRLKKRELLRLERNKYILKGTNPFLVASNILFPSYISFISAYRYYNLTTQLPRTFFVITLKQRKPLEFEGNTIQFIKFDESRFFGFRREILENKFFFIAEPEKAIIDSLYLPEYCPVSETFFALKNADLNFKKLLEYAKKMKSKVLIKRLGYLLDIIGKDFFKEIKISFKGYNFLNPSLPKKGEKNRKWKLIINEVLE